MIEVSGLTYSQDEREILHAIDLRIEEGVTVAIIGPNGAGKSTLLKILLGLIPDYRGCIQIDGMPHQQWLKSHTMGYVPQREKFPRQFPATALEIVLLGLAGRRPFAARASRIERAGALQALQRVQIGGLAGRLVGTLSSGEYQRVMIARALLCDAKYVLMDEPEAGIDADGMALFHMLLSELKSSGKTVLLVSHDISMVMRLCSSIVCLNRQLHCHSSPELLNAEIIKKTYGDVMQLIERHGAGDGHAH